MSQTESASSASATQSSASSASSPSAAQSSVTTPSSTSVESSQSRSLTSSVPLTTTTTTTPATTASTSRSSASSARDSDSVVEASSKPSATPSGNDNNSESASPSSSVPKSEDPQSSSQSQSPSSISNDPSTSSTQPSPSSSAPAESSAPPPSSSDVLSALPSSTDPASTVTNPTATFQSLTVSFDPSLSLTTIVTSVDGHLTTITSALPTSLSTARSSITSAQRTRIIAGATAAGVGVILLLLGALFVYKRHKSRKREFSEAIGRVRREGQGAGGVGLLDGEGFDDDEVPMRPYRDNVVAHARNLSSSTLGPPQSPAPSLFRQRAETGSLFREEGVYPPPQGGHVDPLVGIGSGLGTIVDDVMGPPPGAAPAMIFDSNRGTVSSTTNSLYNDPFRDLSHAKTPSDPSLYYERHHDRTGSSLSMNSTASSTATHSTGPQSLLGLPAGAAGTPKKSSPLASVGMATSTPPSAATWLTRSPKKQHARGLSGSQSSHEA
ncbi:hypothetical protein MKEN_00702400 [Mycena kentingensis (nom. inval.)]|nr:hypothetical protein MKEN_00702400 [Mycena kentingensis (nom. inval.)]